VANPTGLEWHLRGDGRWWYAMCADQDAATKRWRASPAPQLSKTLKIFGRVARDNTGRIVASATSFDHVKYVDNIEDGKLHVEAIWALEHSSSADGK